MKRISIISANSNGPLLRTAAAFLSEWSQRGEVLVVAPTRIAADELARMACFASLRGAHRFTLRQLASHLARHAMAEHGLAPITTLGMEALAARSVYLACREKPLSYFQPVADTPGFARALSRTLGELRLEGVPPEALGRTSAAGTDLARLLIVYTQELKERRLADSTILFGLATETLRKGKHRFNGLPLLLASLRLGNAAEIGFVQALREQAPALLATSLAQDESCAVLEQVLRTQAEAEEEGTGALDVLRAQLFSTESLPERQLDPAALEMFSAPGEGLESVEIARRIRRAASEGVPFDQIGVLLRNPERYQPILEEAFRRAGVPAYFSRGSARPNAAGRAFLALLDCAAAGCSASKFAEYLSLAQVPSPEARASAEWTPPEEESLPAYAVEESTAVSVEPVETEESPVIAGSLRTPAGWEKLLVDAYVVQGPDRWERRLRGLRESLRQRLEQEEDPGRRRPVERDIEQLENLERFALPLIRFLRTFTAETDWNGWLARLDALARMSLKQPESVLAVLSEMQPLGEVGPVALQEVREVLAERLRFLRRDPPDRRYGSVWIGGIEEARALSFGWVFLPGLAEGAFPRRALEDPLLLDEHRAALSPGLLVNEFRTAQERALLRVAAAAAAHRFVVSYPRMDVVQARPRVPSFYALEVVRAAEGRLPELARFGRLAASGSTALLGWPAPENPEAAIDDAEFDIATLRHCLSLPPEKSKGCGRYLVEVHDTLARSLRTRHRRWSRKWTQADGLLDPNGGDALAQLRLTARSYSASALQNFALCPYRFALHAIHKLRPAEHPAPLERMDPLTRGALFHEAQFQLLRLLEADELLPVNPSRLARVLDRADRVFEAVAADYEDRLSPAIPRVWKSEVDELRADLHGWIRTLAVQPGDWVPYRFEFAFGLRPKGLRDPRSTAEEARILAGFRLCGSIDLIEQQAGTGKLRIVDHKTGKPPEQHPRSIGGGTAMQPVLYGLAVEHLLGGHVESGLLHYATQRGNYLPIEVPLDNATRQRAAFALQTIDSAIERGFLPNAPRQGACEFCDYRRVCGPHEELRTRSKPKDALDDLNELRSQP